ncbi:hypothetical protein BOW50_12385 [Solemya velum gill symbiont]|uniref:two-component system response regulator n=1 Tax=Solemya velum gill symbiont TaxID=2340 RepID=UPI000997D88B|nr:diguanylate cyclase [Solemya velum gill symbiont]OOZ74691.1 hypothetical protein BOW50_12385 [Solemya velum gill symbiont]
MVKESSSILVVEDDSYLSQHIGIYLEEKGYQVAGMVSSGEEAIRQVEVLEPDLILMNIVLAGDMDGIEAAGMIQEQHDIPILYLTAYNDTKFLTRARITSPYAYILKPFNEREFGLTIDFALHKHELEKALRNNERHLVDAQRVGKMGSWEWNVVENKLKWTDEIYRIFGVDPEEFGASYEAFLSFVHPEDVELVKEAVEQALQHEQPYSIEHRILLHDGTIKIVHEEANVQFEGKGEPLWMLGTVQDVTEHRQSEERLRLFKSVIENTREAVVITDSKNRIVVVNDAYCEITGYERDELIGIDPGRMRSGTHDKKFYQDMWQSLKQDGSWSGEIWDKRKNGEVYPKWLSISAEKDSRSEVGHYVGIFTDISEIKEKEQRLTHLAYFDPLTGAANRLHFMERLKQEVQRAGRLNDWFAVLFVDLDRFKAVNDLYGHDVGDEVLKEAVLRIRSCIREADVLARLGGDEFTLLLTSDVDDEGASIVGEKIVDVLSQPFLIGQKKIEIGASIGISVYPRDGDSLEKLMLNADRAMYQSKKNGGQCACFVDERLQKEVERSLFIDKGLNKALEQEQFEIHYQPQIDLHSGRIMGMEALLRWNHPEEGIISPVDFIPRAEAIQLIVPIGEWVLKTACKQLKEGLIN